MILNAGFIIIFSLIFLSVALLKISVFLFVPISVYICLNVIKVLLLYTHHVYLGNFNNCDGYVKIV